MRTAARRASAGHGQQDQDKEERRRHSAVRAPAGPLAADIDPMRGALGGKMGQFRHAG